MAVVLKPRWTFDAPIVPAEPPPAEPQPAEPPPAEPQPLPGPAPAAAPRMVLPDGPITPAVPPTAFTGGDLMTPGSASLALTAAPETDRAAEAAQAIMQGPPAPEDAFPVSTEPYVQRTGGAGGFRQPIETPPAAPYQGAPYPPSPYLMDTGTIPARDLSPAPAPVKQTPPTGLETAQEQNATLANARYNPAVEQAQWALDRAAQGAEPARPIVEPVAQWLGENLPKGAQTVAGAARAGGWLPSEEGLFGAFVKGMHPDRQGEVQAVIDRRMEARAAEARRAISALVAASNPQTPQDYLGALLSASRQYEQERPEDFSGDKFLSELLLDPLNLVGLGLEKPVAEAVVNLARRALPIAGSGLNRAAEAAAGVMRGSAGAQVRAAQQLGMEALPQSERTVQGSHSVRPDYANTQRAEPTFVNEKTWYHGTGSADLDAKKLDPTLTKENNLFGFGIYLTDDPAIAGGYATRRARRSGTTVTYETKVQVDKVLDMDASIPDYVAGTIEHNMPEDVIAAVKAAIDEPGATTAHVWETMTRELSDWSHENQIPSYEVGDILSGISTDLREMGYDALTHTGGQRAGKGQNLHQVLILLDPNDTLSIPGVGRTGQVTHFAPYVPEAAPPMGTRERQIAQVNARYKELLAGGVNPEEAASTVKREMADTVAAIERGASDRTVGLGRVVSREDRIRQSREIEQLEQQYNAALADSKAATARGDQQAAAAAIERHVTLGKQLRERGLPGLQEREAAEAVARRNPEIGAQNAALEPPNMAGFTHSNAQMNKASLRDVPTAEMDPVILVRESDGHPHIMEGNNRVGVAQERGELGQLRTVELSREESNVLSASGFDTQAQSYAALLASGETDAARMLLLQFPGTELLARGENAASHLAQLRKGKPALPSTAGVAPPAEVPPASAGDFTDPEGVIRNAESLRAKLDELRANPDTTPQDYNKAGLVDLRTWRKKDGPVADVAEAYVQRTESLAAEARAQLESSTAPPVGAGGVPPAAPPDVPVGPGVPLEPGPMLYDEQLARYSELRAGGMADQEAQATVQREAQARSGLDEAPPPAPPLSVTSPPAGTAPPTTPPPNTVPVPPAASVPPTVPTPPAATVPAGTPPPYNLYGVKPILEGLSLADQVVNGFKAAIGRVIDLGPQREGHASPAIAEIARIRDRANAQGAQIGAQTGAITRKAFTFDGEGRIPDLVTTAFPEGPTTQDVAARLPEFWEQLTPKQQAAMVWLQEQLKVVRQNRDWIGIKDPGYRPDVMEGGFYIPRGPAELSGEAVSPAYRGGGSSRTGAGSFSKTSKFESQTGGIEKDYTYKDVGEAVRDYVRDVGYTVADEYIGTYFKGLTDATGRSIGTTAADRVNPHIRDQVLALRAKIAGRNATVRNQQARLATQRKSAADATRLQGRVQSAADAAAQRYEAMLLNGTTDDLIAQAQRDLEGLRRQSERAHERAGKAAGKQGAQRIADDEAMQLAQEAQRLVDTTAQRYTTKVLDTAAAQTLEMAGGLPAGTVPRPPGMGSPEKIAQTTRDAYRDLNLLQRQADRLMDFTARTGQRLPATAQVVAETARLRDLLRQQVQAVEATLRDLTRNQAPEAALNEARRALHVLETERMGAGGASIKGGLAGAADKVAERLQRRLDLTEAKLPATRADINQLQAQLDALKGPWEQAKKEALENPRGHGQIELNSLRGRSFPQAISDAANASLDVQRRRPGWVEGSIDAVNHLNRSFTATLDDSGVGVQGLLGLYTNPKAWGTAFKMHVRALRDPQAIGSYFMAFDERAARATTAGNVEPTIRDLAQNGGHFGGAESEFSATGLRALGQHIGDLPGIRHADRLFGFFGDATRAEMMRNDLLWEMKRSGRTWEELRASGDAQKIIEEANRATGWTNDPFGTQAGGAGKMAANLALYAPRYFAARIEETINTVIGLPGAAQDTVNLVAGRRVFTAPIGGIEKRLAAKRLLGFIGITSLLTVAANEARGEETDFRPLIDGKMNPNFMMVKNVAGHDISLMGTYRSLYNALGSVATGEPLRALRMLSSGTLRVAFDTITQHDLYGNYIYKDPGTFAWWLASLFTPIAISQEAGPVRYGAKGVQEGDVGKVAGAAGIGVGTAFGGSFTQQSVTDIRDVVTKELYPGYARYDHLTRGQQNAVNDDPRVQARTAERPPADVGAIDQQVSHSLGLLKDKNLRLEADLRKSLDAGISGKDLREMIHGFKSARFQAADTAMTPAVRQQLQKKDATAQDLIAQRYWEAPAAIDEETGRPDFEGQDVARASILQEAEAAGVPPAYITGSAKDSFRGKRFTDPVVRQAIEDYDIATAYLKTHFWNLHEQEAAKNPAWQAALIRYSHASSNEKAALTGKETPQNRSFKAAWNALQKNVHGREVQVRKDNPTLEGFLKKYGYRTAAPTTQTATHL